MFQLLSCMHKEIYFRVLRTTLHYNMSVEGARDQGTDASRNYLSILLTYYLKRRIF